MREDVREEKIRSLNYLGPGVVYLTSVCVSWQELITELPYAKNQIDILKSLSKEREHV